MRSIAKIEILFAGLYRRNIAWFHEGLLKEFRAKFIYRKQFFKMLLMKFKVENLNPRENLGEFLLAEIVAYSEGVQRDQLKL